MASKIALAITFNTDAASVAASIGPNVGTNPHTTGADAWAWVSNLCRFIESECMGRGVSIVYYDTAISASTTGTFTSTTTADQTITVNGVNFTAKSSGATGNQFNIGSTATDCATNLAAAINASTTAGIVGTVGASSAAGVVTFYSLIPGSVGLNIPISESLDNFTLADTTFSTGGTKAHSTIVNAGASTAAS